MSRCVTETLHFRHWLNHFLCESTVAEQSDQVHVWGSWLEGTGLLLSPLPDILGAGLRPDG